MSGHAAAELGFPEFESDHLMDFSAKAQFPKSAASTIPPHPRNQILRLAQSTSICLFQHQWGNLRNVQT